MEGPEPRKSISIGVRLIGIACMIIGIFTEDREAYLKLMWGWAAFSYLGHTILPVKTCPWEPDYTKLWEEEKEDQ